MAFNLLCFVSPLLLFSSDPDVKVTVYYEAPSVTRAGFQSATFSYEGEAYNPDRPTMVSMATDEGAFKVRPCKESVEDGCLVLIQYDV